MAKDGTNRGGARIGSGQKKKALIDKIAEGNPGKRKLEVIEFKCFQQYKRMVKH